MPTLKLVKTSCCGIKQCSCVIHVLAVSESEGGSV